MVCIASWHIAIVLLAVAIQSQAQSNVNQDRNKASTECKWNNSKLRYIYIVNKRENFISIALDVRRKTK